MTIHPYVATKCLNNIVIPCPFVEYEAYISQFDVKKCTPPRTELYTKISPQISELGTPVFPDSDIEIDLYLLFHHVNGRGGYRSVGGGGVD